MQQTAGGGLRLSRRCRLEWSYAGLGSRGHSIGCASLDQSPASAWAHCPSELRSSRQHLHTMYQEQSQVQQVRLVSAVAPACQAPPDLTNAYVLAGLGLPACPPENGADALLCTCSLCCSLCREATCACTAALALTAT
jgi:hypothetical protein